MPLSSAHFTRYCRQMLLDEVGVDGQMQLSKARVLVAGAGGLGSPAAIYLAAAGIGTLGIADPDRVSMSNLHRQILHHTSDLDKLKIDSAAHKLADLNPLVELRMHPVLLDAHSAPEILADYDFVVDCTDNFDSKYLINDLCVAAHKPFSIGGVVRFEGQTLTVVPQSACYRCAFPHRPAVPVPNCAQDGVLGAVAGILGSIQATEVLKYFLQKGTLLTNKLFVYNTLTMSFQSIALSRSPACVACGKI